MFDPNTGQPIVLAEKPPYEPYATGAFSLPDKFEDLPEGVMSPKFEKERIAWEEANAPKPEVVAAATVASLEQQLADARAKQAALPVVPTVPTTPTTVAELEQALQAAKAGQPISVPPVAPVVVPLAPTVGGAEPYKGA